MGSRFGRDLNLNRSRDLYAFLMEMVV